MIISPNTDGQYQPMHSDVQLIKKTYRILKLLEKYESHYELHLIKSQLYDAKAALLNVCIKEANENRYDSDEKIQALNHLESTIELFKKLYKEVIKE